MRIYSFSKILALPLVIIFAGYLYYLLEYLGEQWIFILIPLILLVALYTFHPQIDYWYLKKKPIPLDDEIKNWLNKYSPYYNNLSSDSKTKYENRLGWYLYARSFTSVGTEQRAVPEDIKAAIASEAIKLTLGVDDFLIGDMDRIFIYKHPFPSPEKQFLHTAEVEVEDGTIIMSLSHLLPGLVNTARYYNIVMHCYAEAYIKVNSRRRYPFVDGESWESLEEISGFNKDQIFNTIGYKVEDIRIFHINFFFTFTERYKEILPNLYREWNSFFNQKI